MIDALNDAKVCDEQFLDWLARTSNYVQQGQLGGDWSSILVKSSAVRELCLTLKKTSVYP